VKSAPRPHTIPAAGVDVGFFSTEFSLGRDTGPNGSHIVTEVMPSVATRLIGGPKQLPNGAVQDVVAVESEPGVKYLVGK